MVTEALTFTSFNSTLAKQISPLEHVIIGFYSGVPRSTIEVVHDRKGPMTDSTRPAASK